MRMFCPKRNIAKWIFNLCAKSVFKVNSKCTNNKFKSSTNHEIRIVNHFLSNTLYKRFVQLVIFRLFVRPSVLAPLLYLPIHIS